MTQYVPPKLSLGTLDYSTSECADSEAEYMANLMAEALNIASGPVNVFPLLGVHSQGSSLDMALGYPLSSGTPSGYTVASAFNSDDSSWRSVQQGTDVMNVPAYIGYNFGTKKAPTTANPDRERYFPSALVRKKISSIRIKQGIDARNRATQVKVEASDDGIEWHRVDIINLPNTEQVVTVGIHSTAAYNNWRLVPTLFNGVASSFQWEVVDLRFLEASQMSLETIEDYTLLENRDRSYSRTSMLLKCSYDLLDVQTELAKFGISLPQTYIFTCSFAAMVQTLGRPVIVGDIVELPGEVQYDHKLRPVRKWLEVTDCSWSTEGYTLNWKPQLYRFYAQPILPSVEHRDILGVPHQANTEQSDADFLVEVPPQDDLATKSTEAIVQTMKDRLPQTGSDIQDMAESGDDFEGADKDPYGQDALPPDGEAFTYGDQLPSVDGLVNGHYHRQTYSQVTSSLRPPDRLLKWNSSTGRWSVVEVNLRGIPESHKKSIGKILASATAKAPDEKL